MVKIVVYAAKVLLAAVTALLFFSCGIDGLRKVDGSGNVSKQNRPAQEEFTKISASNGLEIVIEQGSVRSIVVEADDNLHEHIKTEIRNNELEISSDVRIGDAEAKRVIVTLPTIEKIEASAGVSVTGKNTLKGKSISFSSDSGSNLDVMVDAEDITAESSSGANLKIGGKTENLQAGSSSGATLNAKALTAKSVDAEASSGGNTYINPTESLSAEASSGGNIHYVNTPAQLEMKKSSGGSVNQG